MIDLLQKKRKKTMAPNKPVFYDALGYHSLPFSKVLMFLLMIIIDSLRASGTLFVTASDFLLKLLSD